MLNRRLIEWGFRFPVICLAVLGPVAFLHAQTYMLPASGQADVSLDSGWKFILQNVSGAQANEYIQ
jgi:hypothetical protein